MGRKATLEKQLYHIGLISLVAGIVSIYLYFKVFLVYLPTFPCAFYSLFGLYCPGCGGTRAVLALLQGHFLQSLWYHPLVLYVFVMYGGFMLSHTLEKCRVLHICGWRFHNWYLYTAVVIVFINWIVKNLLLVVYQITI
ncbi:MAG: DUF2752 domain-containing protein [Roseburia sp.]|nr:DUF2752 domain-containing protein [Roseburia sp.]